jgi:hypothetical protein
MICREKTGTDWQLVFDVEQLEKVGHPRIMIMMHQRVA